MNQMGIKRVSLLFLLLLAISLLFFFSDRKGWITPVKNFASKPIVWVEGKIFLGYQGISGLVGSFVPDKAAQKRIFELEGKLRQLAVEQNQLSLCLEENEKMKKLLGASLPIKWKFMEAKVVGISDKMRILRGKKDGVKEGMMVVSENILVGKVVSVGDNFSLVQLVSDLTSKIPVVVKRPNQLGIQARGLLSGGGGGNLLLDRVLQGEDIQKGDLVLTSGEGEWLPDLVIGLVEDVLPKSAEIYQKAKVSPLIDYQKLRIVFMVVGR